jgi:hypothetical protein
MQRLCPNCGNPAEQDEVFCAKCGTRLTPDAMSQNQYQSNIPNANQNQYQTPTPNAFQNQYQTPTPNNYQNQYSYNPGQQNNPSYTPPPVYPQQPIGGYKKSSGGKVLKGILIGVGVIAVILVALGIYGSMLNNDSKTANNPGSKDTNQTTNTKQPTTTKPTDTQSTKPNDTTKPAETTNKQSLAIFDINVNAKATYNKSDKKIYVDYSVKLSNKGKGNAEDVKVYFDTEPNDENAKSILINEKKLINFDKQVPSIGVGAEGEIKQTFWYDNVEPDAPVAQESSLNDIQNRYIKIPLTIEWQENGAPFVITKIKLSPAQ